MAVAERISEERKRLGLSQAAFAEAVGMSLSTQKRYEKGEREPDAGYLNQLGSVGVDVQYVITGVREGEDSLYEDAIFRVLLRLCATLGVERDQLDKLIEDAYAAERASLNLKNGHAVAAESVDRLVQHFLEANRNTVAELDVPVLETILDEVETALNESQRAITSERKAQLVATLYRSSLSAGKVDRRMIRDVLTLTVP